MRLSLRSWSFIPSKDFTTTMIEYDAIRSALATTIICLGLAILLPFLWRGSPEVHLQIHLEINTNGIQTTRQSN